MPTGSPMALLVSLHLICRVSRAGGTPGMAGWGRGTVFCHPLTTAWLLGVARHASQAGCSTGACHRWGILTCLPHLPWT